MLEKLKSFEASIQRLFQITAIVLTFCLPIVACPDSFYNLPKFMIVCSFVLAFLWIRSDRPCTRILLTLTLLLGLVSVFTYWIMIDTMTIEFGGKIYIRGELTEDAKDILIKKPSLTEKELFIQNGKKVDLIWTAESRVRPRIILGALYSSFIFFFGLSLMGVLEIMHNRYKHISKSKSGVLKGVPG